MPQTLRRRLRTSLRLLLAFAPAVAIGVAACGPRQPPPGGRGGTPTAAPSATPIAWAADARAMLTVGLGAGRPAWAGNPLKPGERLTWFVSMEPRSTTLRRVTVTRDLVDATHWHLLRAPADASLDVVLTAAGTTAASIAWSTSGAAPEIIRAPDALASMWTPPLMLLDSSFTAAGGTFVGNEVVRVPAGVFRARHALLRREGVDWHLYVTRGIPGGLVKVERFPEGSTSASLVLELDSFTRIRREPHPR